MCDRIIFGWAVFLGYNGFSKFLRIPQFFGCVVFPGYHDFPNFRSSSASKFSNVPLFLVTGSEGWTNKFIFPPYEIQVPDAMVTNFHPPGSTLLMMNSAMLGHDLAMHSINEAIKEKYRFLAFGDAMLII